MMNNRLLRNLVSNVCCSPGLPPHNWLQHPSFAFPQTKALESIPDTHLALTFPSVPTLGKSGQIRIYDAADNKLVDTLDLSIPPGPAAAGGRGGAAAPAAPMTPIPYEYALGRRATNANTVPGTPSGVAVPTPADFSADHHRRIHRRVSFLSGDHSRQRRDDLSAQQSSDLQQDVLCPDRSRRSHRWRWHLHRHQRAKAGPSRRRRTAPAADSARIVVSGDGTGDFNTVQGAMDFVPDSTSIAAPRVTIFIRNGTYEEIVYFRNKSNVTLLGEDREKVVVHVSQQ